MPTEQFRLTPAAAESRYQHLLTRRQRYPNADDPLFRPIDADDFRVNGAQAERLQQPARERPDPDSVSLPANIRLIDPATNAPSTSGRSTSGARCPAWKT